MLYKPMGKDAPRTKALLAYPYASKERETPKTHKRPGMPNFSLGNPRALCALLFGGSRTLLEETRVFIQTLKTDAHTKIQAQSMTFGDIT